MRRVFTVPGTPHGKQRARTVSRGGSTHSYTPPKTASYERLIAEQYKLSFPGQKPLTGALELVLRAYMPIPASWPQSKKAKALSGIIKPTVKPDCDNVAKCMDALNGIAWEDDKQITFLAVTKEYSAVPRLEVEIWQE